jgi:glycosyltransferase involved in cell wall biosynthesis
MWAFTGGCHYNEDCRKFESKCNDCPQLMNKGIIDFSKHIFNKKTSTYSKNIQIVCPSNWLMLEAKKSKLLSENPIEVIPYNIDFTTFKKYDKKSALKEFGLSDSKKVILFVSMNVEDERKGFSYFKKAISYLETTIPTWKNEYQILAIGRHSDEKHFETEITYTGRLNSVEKISKAYSAAEVFVAPSLQDNLPNTVIESLACGTPVVAFNIGGMPDMIEHKHNGYLCEYLNVEDLSRGIQYCVDELKNDQISEHTFTKYNNTLIAEKYTVLYQKMISCHSN